jgi:hypothetical protein
MRKKKDWMGQDLINQNNINYGSWNKDWDNINKWYTTQVPPETRPQWQNWQGNLNGYPYWPNQNGFNSEFNNGFNGCCIYDCLFFLLNTKLLSEITKLTKILAF